MLHSTTLGRFLSRATSSRIACACTARVASFTVSAEKVGTFGPWKIPAARAVLRPTAAGLVDDDHAVPVGVVEDLLGVRIVGGAERVRTHPLHQREVVHHERVVVAFAAHGGVLVLAEPPT